MKHTGSNHFRWPVAVLYCQKSCVRIAPSQRKYIYLIWIFLSNFIQWCIIMISSLSCDCDEFLNFKWTSESNSTVSCSGLDLPCALDTLFTLYSLKETIECNFSHLYGQICILMKLIFSLQLVCIMIFQLYEEVHQNTMIVTFHLIKII